MRLSECGVRFITEFEGFVDHVYRDAVNVETIGYGTTDQGIINAYRGRTITAQQAMEWLRDDVDREYGASVNALPWSFVQTEFDALTSFAYNLGVHIFDKGAIRTALESGHPSQVGTAMRQYNHAGTKVLAGLTRRRDREARLFADGEYGFRCVEQTRYTEDGDEL